MSRDDSENSEQDESIYHPSDMEESGSGQSSSANSISLALKSSDIFSAFQLQDIIKLMIQYWYILIIGVVGLGVLFFMYNLEPPPFAGETVLRIRSMRGKKQVSEAVSIRGEAEDLRSPNLIRSVLRKMERSTVVVPVSSLKGHFEYFLEKRKQSALISSLQADKYTFDLQHFTVEEEEGMYYVAILGGGKYALYDEDKDEILRSEFGKMAKDTGINIQIDSAAGVDGQWYELRYLPEDEMVSWAVEHIKTGVDGKDGVGGSIRLYFETYDKIFLTQFLDVLGKTHVTRTEERLKKGTVKALKQKQEKLSLIEQELFKQERELEKLQRKSAEKGNLATTASELRQQANLANGMLANLERQHSRAAEYYEDLRSLFTAEHPIVVNAREDLEKLKLSMEKIEGSSDGIPELLLQIQTIEESITTLGKEKQLLDEEITKIKDIQKASKSYISILQEPQILGKSFTGKPPKMAILGMLCGLVMSVIGLIISNLRFVKTFTFDGDQSAFSDGNSVSEEYEGSARSSSQFLSSERSNFFEDPLDQSEEYISQDEEMIFQDYSSEVDSVSMYVSEASSPSELDAPDVHSVSLSVMDMDSQSIAGEELDFLEQDMISEDVRLIATGIWNSKTFSEKSLRKLAGISSGIIEVVNNTEANLVNAIVLFSRRLARKNAVLIIDMQTDESLFAEFHKTEGRKGFWDVLAKKSSLKSSLLQTSHKYFVLPAGNYHPNEVRIHRVGKLMDAVSKKFSHIIVVHSQDISIWRALRSQMKQKSFLFWLQADYSLYQMGSASHTEKKDDEMLPHKVLLSLFADSKIVNVQNQSQIKLVNIIRKSLDEKILSRVLFVEAKENGETEFASIAQELRLGAILDGKSSLKDTIHEVQPSLFVLPGSVFSGKEKLSKVNSLLHAASKNFSHIIVLRNSSAYPHTSKQKHVILDENGMFRGMEEAIRKL